VRYFCLSKEKEDSWRTLCGFPRKHRHQITKNAGAPRSASRSQWNDSLKAGLQRRLVLVVRCLLAVMLPCWIGCVFPLRSIAALAELANQGGSITSTNDAANIMPTSKMPIHSFRVRDGVRPLTCRWQLTNSRASVGRPRAPNEVRVDGISCSKMHELFSGQNDK
jgi:hypothetical protein